MSKLLFTKAILVCISVVYITTLNAQTFKLVKDINQQKDSHPSNTVNNTDVYAVLNGKAYFAADDGVHGAELWSSDGTEAGTMLVKDIYPGANSSRLSNIYSFKNKLYFFATKDGKYAQFWRSDGTAANTVLLKDSFSVGTLYNNVGALYVEMGNELYFTVNANVSRDELWKTNGNTHSVQKVVSVDTLPGYTSFGDINNFTVYKNRLYFTAGNNSVLYYTDGTTAGTHRFAFTYGNTHGFSGVFTKNDLLYFTYHNQVWRSSGDSVSTVAITQESVTNLFIQFKNQFYTINADYSYPPNYSLSKADSVLPYNYHIVKALNPENSSTKARFIQNLNDKVLIFLASDSIHRPRLWATDGTEAGTKLLVPDHFDFKDFFAWGDKLYFSYTDNSHGEELWVTDGTVAGTKMVADINPGIYSSVPGKFTLLDSVLLFAAGHNTTGIELWKSNGTGKGTSLVKNINNITTSSSYPFIFPLWSGFDTLNNHIIFVANDGIHGNEVWSTDGTNEGTFLLNDMVPGSNPFDGALYSYHARVNTEEFFFGRSATNGFALWKTKGLPNTTGFVSNLFEPATGIWPIGVGAANSNVFAFAEVDGSGIHGVAPNNVAAVDSLGDRLFVYNAAGQLSLLKKGMMHANNVAAQNNLPTAGNNVLFFIYPPYGSFRGGLELWRSDGTVAGTVVVKNLYPGQNNLPNIANNIQYKGQVFFIANSGSNFNGTQPEGFDNNVSYLWRSDGTAEGTQMVKKMNVYLYSPLAVCNNKLYFIGEDASTGDELWVTDGTEAGTHLVKDITPGAGGTGLNNFTEMDGTLYFSVTNNTTTTLWKTDGTEAGTIQVAAHSSALVKGDHKLYFIINNYPKPDSEIWQSDGTEVGTIPIAGAPGIEGAKDIGELCYLDGHLYLVVTTNTYGTELYRSEYLLPVTMLSFTARLKNTDALLQWSTLSEQNNSHFNVQRSTNGVEFTTISRVNALTNIKENDYNYTDAGVTALGVNKLYYRLQQFDLDGKFTYSKTIPLTITPVTTLQVGPNPAVDVANIYSSVNLLNAVITVTDMSGHVLYSARKDIQAGSKTAVSLQGYAKGVYTIAVQGANAPKQTFKLVVGR